MKQFSRLAFFDFDGTLTDGGEFVYTELWKKLKVAVWEDSHDLVRFKRGEITYAQWVAHDVERFQSVKATKDQFIAALKEIKPMPGARELIVELKARGFGIMVVSGGLDLVVETVFSDHQQLFDEVFINRYHFDENGFLIGATPTPYDFKDKDTCIRDTAKKYNIPLSATIFTGDNLNDVEAAQVAGISFAFNTTHEGLIKAATHHIQKKDLREILKYL